MHNSSQTKIGIWRLHVRVHSTTMGHHVENFPTGPGWGSYLKKSTYQTQKRCRPTTKATARTRCPQWANTAAAAVTPNLTATSTRTRPSCRSLSSSFRSRSDACWFHGWHLDCSGPSSPNAASGTAVRAATAPCGSALCARAPPSSATSKLHNKSRDL